jgi:hypothetical protein
MSSSEEDSGGERSASPASPEALRAERKAAGERALEAGDFERAAVLFSEALDATGDPDEQARARAPLLRPPPLHLALRLL